jgi:hypothetical protein
MGNDRIDAIRSTVVRAASVATVDVRKFAVVDVRGVVASVRADVGRDVRFVSAINERCVIAAVDGGIAAVDPCSALGIFVLPTAARE